jgi:chaperonin GroES
VVRILNIRTAQVYVNARLNRQWQ